METRICGSCKRELPKTNEFFTNKVVNGINKLQHTCKECRHIFMKKHYLEHKEMYKEKARLQKIQLKELVIAIKENSCCHICGESRWWVLDFHHIDKNLKDIGIADLIGKGSKNKLIEEINKCIILCANCHRDLHYKEKIQASEAFIE